MTQASTRIRRLPALLVAVILAACGPAPSASPSASTAAVTTPGASPTATATSAPSPTSTPLPTDLLVAADLDGLLVAPELAHRIPIGVSIDDARVARPQSGFNATSLVFQAPVDGYETRYLLVFQELDAVDIGPVRSGRLFLAQWAAEFRGAFGHYGGDRITRAWMKANRGDLFTDLDGMGAGNSAYHRISTRTAPHNAYGSSESLRARAIALGASPTIEDDARRLLFRDDSPTALRGVTQTVVIPYKTVTVGFTYDLATNAYDRTLDGAPHLDAADGRQVTARTIVVLYMPFRTDSTIEKGHSRPVLGFIGRGTALVISEGKVVEATWSKKDDRSPTILTGPDGQEVAFVRGRIFFQIVPLSTTVTVD